MKKGKTVKAQEGAVFDYMKWYFEQKCDVLSSSIAESCFWDIFWENFDSHLIAQIVDEKMRPYTIKASIDLTMAWKQKIDLQYDAAALD